MFDTIGMEAFAGAPAESWSRRALLIFPVAVDLGILAAAPHLVRRPASG